jgi:polysaccharide export outer membrane protein
MQRTDLARKSCRQRRQLPSLAAALLLVAVAGPIAAQTITLQPGDVLRVAVLNEPELSGDFPVTDGGMVMLPLLGSVQVTDRSVAAVMEDLRAGYVRELARPDFLLMPLVRIAVTGEVRQPGVQLVDPTQSLKEVLATAGGTLPTAKRGVADLVRDGEARRVSIEPGSADLAIQPRSGDAVHVPRQSWLTENMPVIIGAAATVAAATVTSLLLR